jgi:hypothetical protein
VGSRTVALAALLVVLIAEHGAAQAPAPETSDANGPPPEGAAPADEAPPEVNETASVAEEAEAASGFEDAAPVAGGGDRLIVLASPTDAGARLVQELRALALARGYRIAAHDAAVRAAARARLPVPPSPAALWRLTHLHGADRLLFAVVEPGATGTWVQIMVADRDGAGPWLGRGWVPAMSTAARLRQALSPIVDRALPAPRASVPPLSLDPPTSYLPAWQRATSGSPPAAIEEAPEPVAEAVLDPGWGYDFRGWLGSGLMAIERVIGSDGETAAGRAGFVGAGVETRITSDGGRVRFEGGAEAELRIAEIPDQGSEMSGTFRPRHGHTLARVVPTVGFDFEWIGGNAGAHVTNATRDEEARVDLAGRLRFGYTDRIHVELLLRDGPRCWRADCVGGLLVSFPNASGGVELGVSGGDSVSLWSTFPFRVADQILFGFGSLGSSDNGPTITFGVGISALRSDAARPR